MLRPFTLVSDEIAYPGNVANIRFPSVPKGSARCAVVGIRAQCTGANVATIGGWSTLLSRLTIAGRNYVQGSIPIALLDGSTAPQAAPLGNVRANRFPGSAVPLPGAELSGAGMSFGPSDQIQATLTRFDGNSYVRRLALDCVQFPDDPKDPQNEIYNQMRGRGIGEAFLVGSRQVGWPAAGTVAIFDEVLQPPQAQALRRTGLRGVVLANTTGAPQAEYGAAAGTTMNNILVRTWTSFQRAAQNLAAPARAILGLPGYEPATGIVDLQNDERADVELTFNGTAAPAAGIDVFVLQMFEGRSPNAPTLEAANAIS